MEILEYAVTGFVTYILAYEFLTDPRSRPAIAATLGGFSILAFA